MTTDEAHEAYEKAIAKGLAFDIACDVIRGAHQRFWEKNFNAISRHSDQWERDMDFTRWLLKIVDYGGKDYESLEHFAATYGTTELLNAIVIALILEREP